MDGVRVIRLLDPGLASRARRFETASYDAERVPDRAYTDADLDAAVAAISDPARLKEAQEVVMRTAPSLQKLLATALNEGGWFEQGHDQAVREAAGKEDPFVREREVRTLVAEETRLGMLVGVAVGFELARELDKSADQPTNDQED